MAMTPKMAMPRTKEDWFFIYYSVTEITEVLTLFKPSLVLDSARGKDLVGSGKAGQTSREEVSIPSTNPLTSFNQLDIERIEFKVRTLRDSEDPIKDVVFTIWPNDPTLRPQANNLVLQAPSP
jgi:hypothetical protein